MNLRNRKGKPCVTSVTIILFEKTFRQTSLSFKLISVFVEDQKTSMLSEFPTKHANNSPVTFVTLKNFAVLFFLPSCRMILQECQLDRTNRCCSFLFFNTIHFWKIQDLAARFGKFQILPARFGKFKFLPARFGKFKILQLTRVNSPPLTHHY